MNILIVAPEKYPVPPLLGNSVEICIYEIARKLAEHHQVTVISRQNPRYKRVAKQGSLTIVRVPGGSPDTYLQAVLDAIQGQAYDLIQVDNRPQYAAAIKELMPHTPVSLFLHSLTFVQPPRTSVELADAQLSRVDWIVANSGSLRDELAALFPNQENKLAQIHLGTDVARFRPASRAKKERLQKKYRLRGSFQVLFIGRIIERKGISVLIEAVHSARKKVPGAGLLIAGKAWRKSYKTELGRQARELGVPVKFLGHIPHAKMHKIYWLADCFVCPSQEHEAFGLVNVEAMASGIPVVASANGGINEIIRSGHNGITVEDYKDPESFARTIVEVAANQAWAKNLAKQARKDAVQHFSWQSAAQSLAEFYRTQLEEGHETETAKVYSQQMGQDDSDSSFREAEAEHSRDEADDRQIAGADAQYP